MNKSKLFKMNLWAAKRNVIFVIANVICLIMDINNVKLNFIILMGILDAQNIFLIKLFFTSVLPKKICKVDGILGIKNFKMDLHC